MRWGAVHAPEETFGAMNDTILSADGGSVDRFCALQHAR
jgi:hypothetical protein